MKKTKKDNAEKTVEEFEREAKARIAARKGKGPKLAQTYDELILASISIRNTTFKSISFYQNGAYVKSTLVSEELRVKHNVLSLWKEITDTPQKELSENKPTPAQHEAIVGLTESLVSIFCEIGACDTDSYFNCFPTNWWTEDEHRNLQQFYTGLLDAALCACASEIDIAVAHPKTWRNENIHHKIGVLHFDSLSLKEMHELWDPISTKVHRGRTLNSLLMMTEALKGERANIVLPFCTVNDDRIRLFEAELKEALLFPYDCLINGCSPFIWLVFPEIYRAINDFLMALLNYLHRARASLPGDSHARRKWLEVEAEYIAKFAGSAPSVTPEEVDHIIALLNDAAREQWIEARMTKNTKALDAETDKTLFRPPQTVRLADDQMAQITKGQSTIKKEVNVVKQIVRGEHTKRNEKTPERQRCVDCAKKHYYRILNEGIVKPRNAITAACHAADKEMKTTFGTYKTEGCFTEALRRVIDARNAHYGAKAADPNLPNP